MIASVITDNFLQSLKFSPRSADRFCFFEAGVGEHGLATSGVMQSSFWLNKGV
jgi:hypothetical protein